MELIRLITENLPQYMKKFGSLLVDPKKSMAQERAKSERNLENSLTFFGISLFLFTILQIPIYITFTETDIPRIVIHAFGISIAVAIAIYLYAVALHIAWRLIGWRNSIRSFFITEIYYVSVLLVVLAMLFLSTEGIFAIAEPDLYEKLIDTKKYSQEFLESPTTIILGVIIIFSIGLIIIWYIMAWGNYRQINGVNEWQSLLAFLIAFIFAIPIYFLFVSLETMFARVL